jgi:hypothetical protein
LTSLSCGSDDAYNTISSSHLTPNHFLLQFARQNGKTFLLPEQRDAFTFNSHLSRTGLSGVYQSQVCIVSGVYQSQVCIVRRVPVKLEHKRHSISYYKQQFYFNPTTNAPRPRSTARKLDATSSTFGRFVPFCYTLSTDTENLRSVRERLRPKYTAHSVGQCKTCLNVLCCFTSTELTTK